MERQKKISNSTETFVFLAIVLGFFVYSLAGALGYPDESGKLPLLVSLVGIGLTLLTALIEMKMLKRDLAQNEQKEPAGSEIFGIRLPSESEARPLFRTLLWLYFLVMAILYAILLKYIGFVLSSIAFLFAGGLFLGAKNYVVLSIISIAVSLTIYYLFAGYLYIFLPTGTLF